MKMKNGCVWGVLLASVFLGAASMASFQSAMANPVKLGVSNPTGAVEISNLFAARLPDLNGKTICELSDGIWEDHRTFPLIRQLMQKRFPDAKIIPYKELPIGTTNIDVDGIAEIVKKKGCQAVIVGNSA